MTSPTVGTAEHPFNIDVVQQMGQEGLVIATTNPVSTMTTTPLRRGL